jgi:CBS domain-containing protein
MRCKDVVHIPVFRCNQETPVRRCAELMRDHGIGFLPVVADGDQLRGVITDRDLALRVLADGLDPETPVGRVMSTRVVACRADDDLSVAEELMIRNQKSRLVLVDDAGRVIGVMSLADIAKVEATPRAGVVFAAVARRESKPPQGS